MKYDRICIMAPTYGRARDRLPAFLKSAYNTAESAICFCLCVNRRDEATQSLLASGNWPEDMLIEVIEENTIQPDLAYYFNLMYDRTRFGDGATLVSMFGDDMVFETQSWDQIVLERVNATGGKGVYWCDDAYIAHERLPVNLMVTRDLVRATRLPFMCPYYRADMIDTVWGAVASYTGLRQYIPEVVVRHEHNTKLPVREFDKTFERLRPLQQAANDKTLQRSGGVYAAMAAGNLISAGYGSWQG